MDRSFSAAHSQLPAPHLPPPTPSGQTLPPPQTAYEHYCLDTLPHRIMRFTVRRFDIYGTTSVGKYWLEHVLWWLLVGVPFAGIAIYLAFGAPLSWFQGENNEAAGMFYALVWLPFMLSMTPIFLAAMMGLWQIMTFAVTIRRARETTMPLWLVVVLMIFLPGIAQLILGCIPRSPASVPEYFVPPNHPEALRSGFNSVRFSRGELAPDSPEVEAYRKVSVGVPIIEAINHRRYDFAYNYPHRYLGYVGARQALRNLWTRAYSFSGRASMSEFAWTTVHLAVISAVLCIFLLLLMMVSSEIYLGTIFDLVLGLFFATAPIITAVMIALAFYAVAVRRLHDAGLSGWYVLLPVPLFLLPPSAKGFIYDPHPAATVSGQPQMRFPQPPHSTAPAQSQLSPHQQLPHTYQPVQQPWERPDTPYHR